MPNFVQGWSFEAAMAAEVRMLRSGRYATVGAAAPAPRKAVSLTHLRSRVLDQGMAGTCYAHSTTQLFEMASKSLGFEPFAASRRFVAWATKQLEGGGNPGDGGSPTDAIRAMAEGGVGVAHERLWPYPVLDSERAMLAALAGAPPQSLYADATKTHLEVPVSVKSFDQVVSLIDGRNGKAPGLPVANGFQVPAEMQSDATFVKNISGYLGGHSELCVGFAQPGVFDDSWWLELENSWNEIYQPLPTSLAKLVEGYEPSSKSKTSSNWIRKDLYLQCCQQGCEHMSATSVSGLAHGTVKPTDTLSALLRNGFVA